MLKSKLAGVARLFIGIGLIICGYNLTGTDENLKLASGGKTDYKIVITETGNPIDNFAVAELQKFLSEITGAEFKSRHSRRRERRKNREYFLGGVPLPPKY